MMRHILSIILPNDRRFWPLVRCLAIPFGVITLFVLVGCSPWRDTLREEDRTFWQAYSGDDAGAALQALKEYREALIRRNRDGGPYALMTTELRLFALAHYLGDTNLARTAFERYTNNLNEIQRARGADATNLPPQEALLSLEVLERNFQIGWKTNTNALAQLPPSEAEVEAYADLFGAGKK